MKNCYGEVCHIVPADSSGRTESLESWRVASNKSVVSRDTSDPESRIGKMKDGRAHMKYKAENVIDLETELIVVAEIYHGDRGDTSTIQDSVNTAQLHLNQARTGCQIEQVVADKGHHSEDSLDRLQNEAGKRTYIPEPKRKTNRTWKGKPQQVLSAFRRNRRNTRGFVAWKKSASVFCRQRRRTIWGGSCAS